jgi:uncharacterized MAPEG superfamily protein
MFHSLNGLLGLCILLGLVHLVVAAALGVASRGNKWALGPRDGDPPPLSRMGARADRAFRNFLETFPFFAAALVCAIAIDRDAARAVLGAQLYLWGRVAYLPLYLSGIPVLRTLAWATALAGIIVLVTVII